MQGVGAADMSNGDQPVIGISTKYQDPGVYTVEVCSDCSGSWKGSSVICISHACRCLLRSSHLGRAGSSYLQCCASCKIPDSLETLGAL